MFLPFLFYVATLPFTHPFAVCDGEKLLQLDLIRSSVDAPKHSRNSFPMGEQVVELCGEIYIGRTDRCLRQRMAEHTPRWLIRAMTQRTLATERLRRNPTSSITKHIMETGHVVDPANSFQVLLRNKNPKLLAFSEAMLINTHRPALCVHKLLTHAVCLPWN
ncbi:uncharacterized protein DEA37_0006419 [Paragonimus westermani]|uniref:Secreted protein n=1 Tax=Paragonimus westermani TaxID=34504 RepID=A0A5J4NBZ9_9TREM|nr:uncharacterized protein DEA37_0006419 [Paragonimus westermani]